jgi:hypothetical protein
MRSFLRPAFLVPFVISALVFGLLLPFAVGFLAFAYILSFGAFPSPVWMFPLAVVLLILLGVFAGRRDSFVLKGIVAGGLVGIFAFAIYLPFGIRHRAQEKLEQQRVIFPSGSPLISLRLSGASDQVIWHIQALREPRSVGAVRYGAVPSGFRQVFPASGPPRLLVPPEPIRLDANAVGFDATNTGQATSADAVAFYSFARKNSPGTSSGLSGSKVN